MPSRDEMIEYLIQRLWPERERSLVLRDALVELGIDPMAHMPAPSAGKNEEEHHTAGLIQQLKSLTDAELETLYFREQKAESKADQTK